MNKNNQKEVINLSNLIKENNAEEKIKLDDKNIIKNISEDKNVKKEVLPKLTLIKDNNFLNQKRERNNSNSKENEEEITNNLEDKNINNVNNINISRKRTSVNEAKKEMKDFELLILNTEKEIQKKYGIIFPDLSFEDNFPDYIKNKLIDDFLESPKIKKLLNEANNQKIN